MTRMITRQIVGYDPVTEAVAFEHYIPADKWRSVASLIHMDDDDPNYIYNYPLDISSTNDIMGMMGERVAQDLNYFLECESAD